MEKRRLFGKLGAISLSNDILGKANIGLWAFELDEGKPPRMYDDETMLGLVGLKHQVSPEETYHAWYDNIDPGSYDLVNEAVAKMMNGEHAEVQYPWHYPDGRTIIVRCGGVRNFAYTNGIRIEGTHQDVSEMLHYDEKEAKRLRETVERLKHEELRSEVLSYIVNSSGDPVEILRQFAEKIRDLLGCDQVIYRDLEETRIMVNSPAIEKTWSVPIEYCRQCKHFDAHHPMYRGGYTEMENCQEGWEGIPVYKDCPIKSSLTRIVYCDGKVAGYLAFHYVVNYHKFTDVERASMEEFTRILSMALSRYEATKRAGELNSVKKTLNMLFSLSSEYDPIIVVEPESGEYDWYMSQADELTVNTSMTLHGESLYKNIGIDSASIIHPDDRAQFQAFYTRENMMKIALTGETQETENRWFLKLEGRYKWKYNKAVKMVDENGKIFVVIGVIDTTEQKEKELETEKQKKIIEEQQALSDGLAREYHTVWLMEGTGRHNLHLYRSTGVNTVQSAVQLGLEHPCYDKSVVKYIKDNVVEEDQDRVIEATKFKTIKKETPEIGTYVVSYKRYNKDRTGYDYHQMCFARAKAPDGKINYIMAFRDADKTIRQQISQQELMRESDEIISGLASEYLALYYINLDDGTTRIYSIDGEKLKDTKKILAKDIDAFAKVAEFANSKAVHPDDRELFADFTRDGVREKLRGIKKYSVRFRRDYGSGYLWSVMDVIKSEDTDEDANSVIVGFAERDIEIRRELLLTLEKNLADEQRHIKAFGDMINAALWTIIVDSDRNEVSISWSNEMRHMLGYTDENDFPNTWTAFRDSLHPDEGQKVVMAVNASLKSKDIGKVVYDMEHRLKKKNGEYCWYHAAGRIENLDNGNIRLFGMIEDISAEKKIEEQQKQLQEALAMAQSASRAKTTFLNNMSHDIRTPMNAIIGYTGLAASHIDHKEQVQDYLSKISQSSDHLLSLINDVLDMSRIESGKMNLEEKEENLSDIIHTLRDIVQADIHSKQLDFYVDAVDVSDEDIICDKLRLNQVLLNVLSNAIKYTQAGGTVTMRIMEKTVKKSGYGTYEFEVKDNGMGMSKEFVKTIYDPFTRVKSSTVSGIQGTGLGMAITKNIVDMMGGAIEIESEPGKGTTVKITLDFKLQSAHETQTEIPELKGVRSLIVDDDANTCMSIANMVRDIGMRDDWCTSGKEAVIRAKDAFRRGDGFKLFIIDWLMPDMNGIETTRRIRQVIGNETPIIILTAYDWSDIEDEAREAGVTAFVSKPMFPSDLHRVLYSCIGKTPEGETVPEVKFDFAGKKILLVEDNVLNREIATELLAEEGFVIDSAEDGSIAVEKMKQAKAGTYDLVLMDIQMPIMNGYEATKAIRALGTEISKIPIIAMTANAFEEDRKASFEAGMNEHVSKPINIVKLKETLAKFLK